MKPTWFQRDRGQVNLWSGGVSHQSSAARYSQMCFLELLPHLLLYEAMGPTPIITGVAAVNTLPFAHKDPRNINDRTKFSMIGQHSSASTGGLVIQLTVQIANNMRSSAM